MARPGEVEINLVETKSPRVFDGDADENISKRPTLLIVEDDSRSRSLEVKMLSGRGYRVLEAGCAGEALRLAGDTTTIDLLLVDFCLPDLDGLELSRRFSAIHPQTPVLLISGSPAWLQDKLGDLDCSDVLTKPVALDKLLHKVRMLVG